MNWGGTRIGFTEISGLKVTTEVIDYREGHMPEYNVIKMPGMQKFDNLSCKRGVFKSDNEFYDWWNTVQLNTIERRDITISMLDENHNPVYTWRVKNAWPTSVDGPGLNATDNNAAIESLEIVHEGITFEAVG